VAPILPMHARLHGGWGCVSGTSGPAHQSWSRAFATARWIRALVVDHRQVSRASIGTPIAFQETDILSAFTLPIVEAFRGGCAIQPRSVDCC